MTFVVTVLDIPLYLHSFGGKGFSHDTESLLPPPGGLFLEKGNSERGTTGESANSPFTPDSGS